MDSKKNLYVNVEIFVKDKFNPRNSFEILYCYVCKEVAKLYTHDESWNRVVESTHFFMSSVNYRSPFFMVPISFLHLAFCIRMNVASEVRNVGTSPERNLRCRMLRSDGEYESVIVIRIFWTASPQSRSLFSTTIYSHARPFITSGIFLRWFFAAKHANEKSESLKSLFAGRTDILEWTIATIFQVTVSAR